MPTPTEATTPVDSTLPQQFVDIARHVLSPAGSTVTEPVAEPESADYGAVTFLLNSRPTLFRVAKTTPTKVGQFVTVWARSEAGPIRPFGPADGIATLVVLVTAPQGGRRGLFVFPSAALIARGVFSRDGTGGKRAFRIYPPWTTTTNASGLSAQRWQAPFFVPVASDTHRSAGGQTDVGLLAQLITS